MANENSSRKINNLETKTTTVDHNIDGCGSGVDPEHVIDTCAAHGLDGIVLLRRKVGQRTLEVRGRARGGRSGVIGLCRAVFIGGPGAPDSLDNVDAAVYMAAALNAPVLTIASGGTERGRKGVINSQARFANRVAVVSDYAKLRNLRLALEPLNPMFDGNRPCLMSVADANHVCTTSARPNVGTSVDAYRVWWDTTLADSLVTADAPRVLRVHMCDRLPDRTVSCSIAA